MMPSGRHSLLLPLVLLLLMGGYGCGGGTSEIGNDTEEVNRQPSQWEMVAVAPVDEVGTSLPHVTAIPDDDGNVHIAYYNAVTPPGEDSYHQLNYLIWNASDGVVSHRVVENTPAPSEVDGFDRCAQFGFALDADEMPVFSYPVEAVVVALAQIEADIMINLGSSGAWSEYTGAIGYVARNPVYTDGHATSNMSLAVDSAGDIHMAYQFFTEGMDSANYRYPDLFYIHRTRDGLEQVLSEAQYGALEEAVDGNTFTTYGEHNSVGYHCKLLLDAEDRPVIVYAEHPESYAGTFALKMAHRDEAGVWHQEIVDTLPDEWTVGAIDAVLYPDGSLAIAYGVVSPDPEPDNAHHLRFASNRTGAWVSAIVDESTWCGGYCRIAVNFEEMPAIAYYDEQSHSNRPHRFLKFVQFDGIRWVTETVDEYENAGRFNSLWFDAVGTPRICSYSEDDRRILMFRRVDVN